jgi:non-canonical poly(A) RNA polymerase PAPD5/7
MHKEVESFVDWISPTPVEDEVRGLIVTHISKVVAATFSDAIVYPFGSFQTKLYLPLGYVFSRHVQFSLLHPLILA